MSDENDKDLPDEESSGLDADSLANEVAAGVTDEIGRASCRERV